MRLPRSSYCMRARRAQGRAGGRPAAAAGDGAERARARAGAGAQPVRAAAGGRVPLPHAARAVPHAPRHPPIPLCPLLRRPPGGRVPPPRARPGRLRLNRVPCRAARRVPAEIGYGEGCLPGGRVPPLRTPTRRRLEPRASSCGRSRASVVGAACLWPFTSAAFARLLLPAILTPLISQVGRLTLSGESTDWLTRSHLELIRGKRRMAAAPLCLPHRGGGCAPAQPALTRHTNTMVLAVAGSPC